MTINKKPGNKALEGRTIVITRPVEQAQLLCQMVKDAGGDCVQFPLLKISPLTDYSSLDPTFKQLSQFDFAIFVSSNAVDQAFHRLHQLNVDFPKSIACIAVGPSTSAALSARGLTAITPPSRFDSEGLLALEELQHLSNKKVLLVRGVGGRELIASTLRARGAKVVLAECYQREQPQPHCAELDTLWQNQGISAVLITSSEAMRHLLDLAQDRPWLSQTKLIVNHARVQEQIHLHYQGPNLSVVVAEATDDQAMFKALLQQFHQG